MKSPPTKKNQSKPAAKTKIKVDSGKGIKKTETKPVETVTLHLTHAPVQEVHQPLVMEEHTSDIPVTQYHENTRLEYGDEVKKLLPTAGTLVLTKEQHAILIRPFEDKDVFIKPDGLIYLSWFKFSGRLTEAFGGTGWTMVPEGMPKILDNLVFWGFHLLIKGIYCGFAIGEQNYFSNGRMTYGEACEGAKSNALVRLGKSIGIGLQLWDEQFIDRWVDLYAEYKWENDPRKPGKQKKVWNLKDGAFGQTMPKQELSKNQETAPQGPSKNINRTNNSSTGENTDFLNQKGNKEPINNAKIAEKTAPVKEIKKSVEELQVDLKNKFNNDLLNSGDFDKLKSVYQMVKEAWHKGQITQEQKEELRGISNKRALDLQG